MLRWIDLQIQSQTAVEQLASELAGKEPFPESIANILLQRNLDSFEKVRKFLRPDRNRLHDPHLLKGVETAVQRVVRAIERQEKILVYGDYDVDGTTSVTLLKSVFRDWGIQVHYYIPDRYKEGYGLSFEGLQFAAREEFNLIIALDCGTKAIDQSRFAAIRGVDLIVIDHHTPGEILPQTVAMINPLQEGCAYPSKILSACGLTLKFAQALSIAFQNLSGLEIPQEHYDPLDHYADLVALSIACDLVPIQDENRILAALGLVKLKTNPLPGIQALKALAPYERPWNIQDLVFFLGPRINSAGRLRHAKAAVELMLGDKAELETFAEALHAYNDERQGLDKAITQEALGLIQKDPVGKSRASTLLHQAHWHKGVIGIVASRVVEHYHRPTILLTRDEDKWVGSGRSVPGFDLYSAILACEEHTLRFGGHKYAAGITISDEQLPLFKEKFERVVGERITPEQKLPTLEIAHRLSFDQITPKFLRMLQLMAPFGPGNMEPVFLAEEVTVSDARILKEEHVRFILHQNGIRMEGIAFNLARRWEEVGSLNLHIAFQPGLKTWKGRTSVQLRIKDFKAV